MKLYDIGLQSEFPENERKLVEVNGKSVGVFRLKGEMYAVLNFCPHQGAPLCKGYIRPWVDSSEAGAFHYDREGEILRCPWHQWEFDIKTGCMVVDGKVRTRTYEVTVETFDVTQQDGRVYLKI